MVAYASRGQVAKELRPSVVVRWDTRSHLGICLGGAAMIGATTVAVKAFNYLEHRMDEIEIVGGASKRARNESIRSRREAFQP
jgi:hypothetical protein